VSFALLPNEYYMIIIFNQAKKRANLSYIDTLKTKYVAYIQQ